MSDIVDLSVNINPYGPSSAMNEAVRQGDFHEYPDPSCSLLRYEIADLHSCVKEQIHVGNGASEIFWSIASAYQTVQQQGVLIVEPTFSEFKVAALAKGFAVSE